MPKRTKRYEDGLIKSLKDPKEVAAYLNAHLEDDEKDLFLDALRDVARAHGFGEIAENAYSRLTLLFIRRISRFRRI